MPTINLIIKGKVQGVFYRATAKDKAENLGLTGWIKNTEEGDVEVKVTGTADSIETFVSWCKQGPPKAIVTSVDIIETAEENFTAFKIMRS